MTAAFQASTHAAISNHRPIGRRPVQTGGGKLGRVARALWEDKAADNLAYRAHISKRSAERFLGGKRRWSVSALEAILVEMCSD